MKKENLVSDVFKNIHQSFERKINSFDCIGSIKKRTSIRNFNILLSTIILLSLTISNKIFSQPTYNSHKTFGGTGNDYAMKIIFDSNGNQIIVGNFSGTVDFDPNQGVNNLTSAGSDDMYILKLDNLGNFLWARRIGGTGSDIISNVVINNQDDIIFSGYFQNSVDFDPGSGTFNLTAVGAQDFVIEKLDNNGNFIFCKAVSGPFSDVISGLGLDSFGNIYSNGWFTGSNTDFDPGANSFPLTSSGGADIFIWKLDPNGNFIWAKKIGGSGDDTSYDLDIDQQGNLLVSGFFANTTDFDPGPGTFNITPYGSGDAFVVKLNSNGGFKWALRVGGTLAESAERISCDLNGNVCIGGSFNGIADFDPGSGTYSITSQGQSDIFLMKVDSLGNFQWAKSIGGSGLDALRDITLESSGHFYVSGHFQNTVDLNPGLPTSTFSSTGLDDAFYSLFDPNGNQVWVKTLGGSGNDYINQTVRYQGNLYLTGTFSNNVDFDPNVGVQNSTSNGLQDAFIIKLNSSLTGINDIPLLKEISIYPNPTKENITIVSNSNIIGKTYSITDQLGKLISNGKLTSEDMKISLNGLSTGLYFLKIENQIFKIVKE